MKLTEYINNLIARGKCTFTLDEAVEVIKKSRKNVIESIDYLKKKQLVASPAKGFYVILTPEYRVYGCLPAEFFIPYLMEYWSQVYYVGFLSAAMFHGATHQQPQVFQIVIDGSRRPIKCGKIRVVFIKNKRLSRVQTQIMSTQKSRLRISTPEATAADLIKNPRQGGGISNIFDVISELADKISPKNLEYVLENEEELPWKQRLGYLLDKLEKRELAETVTKILRKERRYEFVVLSRKAPKAEKSLGKNSKWKIVENVILESDLD